MKTELTDGTVFYEVHNCMCCQMTTAGHAFDCPMNPNRLVINKQSEYWPCALHLWIDQGGRIHSKFPLPNCAGKGE